MGLFINDQVEVLSKVLNLSSGYFSSFRPFPVWLLSPGHTQGYKPSLPSAVCSSWDALSFCQAFAHSSKISLGILSLCEVVSTLKSQDVTTLLRVVITCHDQVRVVTVVLLTVEVSLMVTELWHPSFVSTMRI